MCSEVIMIIKTNIYSEIKINNLKDLHKLKSLMEENNLKINKSQIARELGVDPRTVGKYINGYKKSTTRNRRSPIDEFKPIIKLLLSKESEQIFYYKRVLWQYLTDNYGLSCAQSSFRRYIYNNPEFNEYFRKRKNNNISTKSIIRYETKVGHQAQLGWKENIEFKLKDGQVININIFVSILSYSRFRVYFIDYHSKKLKIFYFLS